VRVARRRFLYSAGRDRRCHTNGKDLERIGILYETHESITDFHATGRHSRITGLLRNRAMLVEARQRAQHAYVRTTMKYAHIGLQDQAEAAAGLPLPKTCTSDDWPGIVRESGGETPLDTRLRGRELLQDEPLKLCLGSCLR
jgi:hypothetical protein